MITTYPKSIGHLTSPSGFVYGERIRSLLLMPFDPFLLKKRVLRKKKDGTKAEMAYYIDLRDMAERLDLIVGPRNWSQHLKFIDAGDRIVAISELLIGGVMRAGESEELKQSQRLNYQTKELEYKLNELAALRAGPNATKRAAVLHGLGAYLYKFKDINTWEEIDSYGQPKNPNIDINKLPDWAVPEAPATLVLKEMLIHLEQYTNGSLHDLPKDDINRALEEINNLFGIQAEHLKKLEHNDAIAVASVIARMTDAETT